MGRAARRDPARPRPENEACDYHPATLRTTGSAARTTPRAERTAKPAQIWAALGDARDGAQRRRGDTGYYAEPRYRAVTAVEPSPVMRAQRPPGSACSGSASVAGALPFADGAFDAAMADPLRPPLARPRRRPPLAAPGGAPRRPAAVGQQRPRGRSGSPATTCRAGRSTCRRCARRWAALGPALVPARPSDPPRLPRRVPDGVLALAGGVPRPGRAGKHLGLRADCPTTEEQALVEAAARRPRRAARGKYVTRGDLLEAGVARPGLPARRRGMRVALSCARAARRGAAARAGGASTLGGRRACGCSPSRRRTRAPRGSRSTHARSRERSGIRVRAGDQGRGAAARDAPPRRRRGPRLAARR